MKRVLIITYYWPPSGGSGVQRWLKMSKYLPENGWQPVIYTADDAEYPVYDKSLEKDVAPEAEIVRHPIVEPYTFYKRFLGMKKNDKVKSSFINEGAKKNGWKENLSVWLRGNLFIPDARCWWIRPSVRFLLKYLKEYPVNAVISTGPPHSMHLIAKALHKGLGLPWIADFRDPWTDIDYYKDLKLMRCSDRKHHRLEHQVLTEATKVVTVGWGFARGLEKHGAKDVVVITNGYDETPLKSDDNQSDKKHEMSTFIMSHIGIVGANRNPETLWAAVADIASSWHTRDVPIRIRLIGHVDNSVIESIKRNDIGKYVEIIPYIPHNQVIEEQIKSDVLLLFVNNIPDVVGILPGKIFEYMASGRPILCIGPDDNDSARVLNETHTGITVDFNDKEKMKSVILDFMEKHQNNRLIVNDSVAIEKYSRRNLTKEYVRLLNDITR